ncbi:MAG: YkgJ family cysteine cluster protein [Deltaproteobacteria bacterium]|nr:YkgJ family cysteine cluster protein [Deltaproteobacteria bacterium]
MPDFSNTFDPDRLIRETAERIQREACTPLPVLAAAADQLEQIAAASPDRPRRACRAGCSACCHLAVSVTIPEALWMAAELTRRLTPQQLVNVSAKIRATSTQISHLTIENRAKIRIPCALLGTDGACTIYDFRPLGCRGWTSFSKEDCDRALAEAEPGHSGAMDRVLWQAAGAVTEGVQTGLRGAGLDAGHYEFHAALLCALETPQAAERWANHEPIFTDCPRVQSAKLAKP